MALQLSEGVQLPDMHRRFQLHPSFTQLKASALELLAGILLALGKRFPLSS